MNHMFSGSFRCAEYESEKKLKRQRVVFFRQPLKVAQFRIFGILVRSKIEIKTTQNH
jgi:hypothetical protein